MTSKYKNVVYSVLPYIFQCYRDHNYQFLIIGDKSLVVASPDEVVDFELEPYFAITNRIEKFEDLSQIYYKDFKDHIVEHFDDAL
jgi:hypothetical protein